MTKGSDERIEISKAQTALLARMERELKPADDELSIKQALDAEDTVDKYLVEERSISHPDRQELAFVLAVLLLTSKTLEERDLDLLGRLNAPRIGLSLFAIAAQVEEMKGQAIFGYEKLTAAANDVPTERNVAPPIDDDAVPF
jgi:hypothetical protein